MKRIALISGCLAALAAIGGGAWWIFTPRAPVYYTDADAIRRLEQSAAPRDILWQPPTKLDAPLNTAGDDYEPRFAWDGLTLYFVRGKAGENADIFVTRKTSEGWTDPQPLPGVNSEYDDLGPAPAGDGETLYFYSNRPGGQGGYDLWMTRRSGDAWQPATNLGPQVNSSFNDYGPAATPDGRRLLFSSNRPRSDDRRQPTPDAWQATLREDLFTRTYDLYSAELSAHGPAAAEPLSMLNSPANEGAACISPVGDFVYFSSDRSGGAGGFDLYRARLLRGAIQTPTALGDGLNTAANELDPGLTQLGYALYFSSDRGGDDRLADQATPASAQAPRRYDLYATTAREVFTESEPAAAIDWAALLAQIWPHLTWLLLGLLAVLLLLAFLRDMKDRRLSLLARCLLLSLLAHLLLLVSFSFWRVAAGVAAAVRGGGPIQISIAGSPATGSIAGQIRGDLTAVSPPAAQIVQTPQAAPPTSPLPQAAVAQFDAPPTLLHLDAAPVMRLVAADAAAPVSAAEMSAAPAAVFNAALPPIDVQLPAEATRIASPDPVPPRATVSAVEVSDHSAPRIEIPTSQPAAPLAAFPVDAADGEFERAVRDSVVSGGGSAAPGGGARDAPPSHESVLPPVAAAESRGAPAFDVTVALPAAPTASASPADSTGSERPSGINAPVAAAAATPQASTIGAAAGGVTGAEAPQFEIRDLPVGSAGGFALASDVGIEPSSGSGGVRDAAAGSVDGPRTPFASAAAPAVDLGALSGLGGSEFGVPTETLAPASSYDQRSVEQRGALVEQGGGSDATERAVARALAWLAAHQSADGRWDADGFDRDCNACGGESDYEVDNALTGLALLSFMGAGHTHTRTGPYQESLQRGVRWLVARQQPDGDLRSGETLYSHGIATIALAEAFGMTGDPELATPVRRAVRFIEKARNRREGGWRYEPGQEGDTSVLGWQIMALKSAEAAGIPVSTDAYQGAREWLDRVSDPSQPGLYAYRPGHRSTVSMTAEGMFVHELLGTPHDDPRMTRSAAVIVDHLPDWKFANTYAWYYATLALYHYGGPPWKTWNEALKPVLLESQRTDDRAAGSWDPVGEWAPIGGRIYQTAICTLMLEVYYRYLPMYGREPVTAAEPTPGSIAGRVTDARGGRALANATVRLDLPGGQTRTATSAADGRYTLEIPATIEHVAVSAMRTGYLPESRNVAARGAQRGDLQVDFELEPISDDVIALEPSPDVHHLGNDRFEGAVNSQFQRESEGRSVTTRFIVPSDDPAVEFRRAELTLLAKGVQCAHEIRINNRRVPGGLPESPEDGSFGEVTLLLDVDLLRSGPNTLRITTTSCFGDIDDFEFVNVQVRLLRE